MIFRSPPPQALPAPRSVGSGVSPSGPPGMGGLATHPSHGLGLLRLQSPPAESPPPPSALRRPGRGVPRPPASCLGCHEQLSLPPPLPSVRPRGDLTAEEGLTLGGLPAASQGQGRAAERAAPAPSLSPRAQEARPGGRGSLSWTGPRAGPSRHTLLSQRGSETGGMPAARGREDWRPGSRRLPARLQVGQRCGAALGCGLSRPCVRGPWGVTPSQVRTQNSCADGPVREKNCSSTSLPWKAQCVPRTPVRPKEKGFLEERAFEVDLEPQLGGGCSEMTGSGGDSTQGAQAGTPPQGAIPGRSRKTVYNLQVASASRLHTPQRDEGQGVGSSEKVGVCVPHSETQASQGTMLEEVCSGLT